MELFTDDSPAPLGKVLLVDDNDILTETMRHALKESFTVAVADSGEACLAHLAASAEPPDLILLDIEMGGIDGFETCRRLRLTHDMPVIFVSAHDALAQRIAAFDSGGDDFLVKPAEPDLILRKAQRIIAHHAERTRLAAEKASLQSMAMDFLRNIGDTGVLLNFMRGSLGLVDYATLAQRLLDATADYGVRCHVQIRYPGGSHTLTPNGPASPLEVSVLEQSAGMGRLFQFSRRLVVNYHYVSLLILDLPEDEMQAGKLRDNVAILAESAEAIAETIALRKEAAQQAAAMHAAARETAQAIVALRQLCRHQQATARQNLQGMIGSVEDDYIHLGLTSGQEESISATLRNGTERTLRMIDIDDELDQRFAAIFAALRVDAPPAA